MTYFFDANVSSNLARMLQALGVPVVHLYQHFRKDAPDLQWIPWVGKRGWVIVTNDGRILQKPSERSALRRANIRAVFIFGMFSQMERWAQACWLLRWWPRIKAAVRQARPGTNLYVNRMGRISELE